MTGDWKTTSVCVDPPMVTDVCEAATAMVSGTKITGTASFKADKTFTLMATIDAMGTLILPASCLKQGSTTLTCKQIQDVLAMDRNAKQLTCSDNAGGCKCLNPYHETVSNSGTYDASGSSVMLTSGMDKATADYCVQDGKLHMNIKTSMGGLPTGQLSFGK